MEHHALLACQTVFHALILHIVHNVVQTTLQLIHHQSVFFPIAIMDNISIQPLGNF